MDLEDRGTIYSYFSPQKVVPGGTNFSVSCDIQWWGIGPSGDFNVSFRASINTAISTFDPEIAKVLVPSINAGGYANVNWYGTFPTGIANNTYYVGWIIDIDGDVTEDNELNNAVYETSYQLEIVIEAELYDRGLSYSGFTPTMVTPTVTQFNIWCDIENVGLAPSGAFNVSFRASYNPIISTLDFEIAKVTVPSIMNGSYADVSWTGMFPYLPFSGFFVGWLIDSDYDVDEGDEEDVGLAADFLNVFNKSDLADRGPSYSGMSETTVEPGVTAFSVFVDIENVGLKTSESCNVSFYASLDTNITTSDNYLGYDSVLPLLNGTYFDATWAGIFPNMTDGSYYIGWIIDVNDDVDEGNEENNQAYILTQLIVDNTVPTSTLSFTPIAGPYTVDANTEFTIIANDGTGSGIFNISYRIDGGSWTLYISPFTLTGYSLGNHTIEYFAVDNLLITESIKSVILTQLIIDYTAPISTLMFTPIAGLYTVDINTEFTITGDDGTGSGIFNISYRIDGGSWTLYTSPFTLTGFASGNHTIEYFAVDNLLNTESIKSVIVYIQSSSSNIPGFNLVLFVSILSIVSVIFIISKRKKNKL